MNNSLRTAVTPEKNRREEVVEPEVVFDGFSRRPGPSEAAGPGLFSRLRLLASAGLIIAGLVMLVPGMLLSASLIGALIGVPLMLAGGALLFAGIRVGAGRLNVKTFRPR